MFNDSAAANAARAALTKASILRRILETRPAFHPGRHVDGLRPREPDRLRHVVGIEAP